MAKSYSELEKKLGEQSQTKPEVDPVSATTLKGEESKVEETKQENTLEIAEDAVENAGLNFDTLAQEYAEKGQLGEESYKALEGQVFQKHTLTNLLQDKKL